MKKTLQPAPQKYKGSKQTTMNNDTPIKWTTCKKWMNFWNSTISQD